MKITIHDVAKKSKVSISTVSRVINNNYPVSKETRTKVEKVIEELEYRPNEIARSLILKTTSNIGVIVPGLTNIFFPTIVENINKTLRKEGFTLSLYISDNNQNQERKILENIVSRNMDGVIIIDPSVENLTNEYLKEISIILPLVIIGGNINKYNHNFVSYDEEVGTVEAFQYLLDLGHENILFIRGDKSLSYDLKENIYKEFVDRNGLKYKKTISVGRGNNMVVVENTERILTEVLNNDKASAVFTCNDLMAVGVINACKNLDLKVPEDLSLIGFDNTLLSRISNPRITSVDLNIEDVSETAALEIIKMVRENRFSMERLVFSSKLVHRDSCKNIKD